MSWIKENKFLAGFAAATAVGAGALGFLTLQAKGRYDEATSTFEQESQELSTLQSAKPFPSADNVKKVEEQRKQHQQIMNELQQTVAKSQLPLEQISPQQFQDRLRQTVDNVVKRAAENKVTLPEKFSFGLERYLAEPPRPEAAPELGRQLKAMDLAVGIMIANRVSEIHDFKRDEVPEERPGHDSESAPTKGGKPAKAEKDLVKKLPFEVGFTSNQPSFLAVLNGIVSAKEQFFIPRVVTVKNEKEQGPPRVVQGASGPTPQPSGPATPDQPATPTNPATPNPGAPQSAITYIVGEEKIDVTMRIDIVDFSNVPTTAAK
ncbi:Amuc_1100 family pilus-like protein [Verrucomicrobiota bacterium sgz303538]